MCNTCKCVCDTHVGQNFIYMAPIIAEHGKVVTGVRFEKKNNIIFLNVETAGTGYAAFANNADAHWNEIPHVVNPKLNRNNFFQIFHWCRHIVINDINVRKDQVVVGVQLYPVPGKRCAFNLRIFGQQVNIFNGKYSREAFTSHTSNM